jgi:hypothetical protein
MTVPEYILIRVLLRIELHILQSQKWVELVGTLFLVSKLENIRILGKVLQVLLLRSTFMMFLLISQQTTEKLSTYEVDTVKTFLVATNYLLNFTLIQQVIIWVLLKRMFLPCEYQTVDYHMTKKQKKTFTTMLLFQIFMSIATNISTIWIAKEKSQQILTGMNTEIK